MEYFNTFLLVWITVCVSLDRLDRITEKMTLEEPEMSTGGEFYIPPKETDAQKMVKRGIRNAINDASKNGG